MDTRQQLARYRTGGQHAVDATKWVIKRRPSGESVVRDDVRLHVLYLDPNETMPDFQHQLDALEDAVSSTEERILVGGDFNARALEWSMPQSDSRGKRILEMAVRTGLVVLNTGSTPTFRRPGYEGSIPGITFASESLASSMDGWRVLEVSSASDQQYIAFGGVDATCRRAPTRRSPYLWNVAGMNIGKFVEALGAGRDALGGPPGGGSDEADNDGV